MDPAIILIFAILFSLWGAQLWVGFCVEYLRQGKGMNTADTIGSFIMDIVAAALWGWFYYQTH